MTSLKLTCKNVNISTFQDHMEHFLEKAQFIMHLAEVNWTRISMTNSSKDIDVFNSIIMAPPQQNCSNFNFKIAKSDFCIRVLLW